MTGSGEGRQPVARIVRVREGKLLGGVCAGLPDFWGLGTNGLRLMFVFAGLLGGIGVVVYFACWLVIPAEDHDPDADPVRSVVLLAWAIGGLVALVLLGAVSAAATVFGFGWLVFALAAIVAGLTFSPLRSRIPTVTALLLLTALTVPAVAVGLSPLRLTLQSGASVVSPKTYHAAAQTTYRSGFGTLLVDLRNTPVPSRGNTVLHIDAGLRRTIVALPSNACVRVRINYDVHLFPAHLAALFSGRGSTEFNDVVLFGTPYGAGNMLGTRGTIWTDTRVSAPQLTIDFTSQGGGLYVRDYPSTVDPDFSPTWPGVAVHLEPHPYLTGEPRRLIVPILRAWRHRLIGQRASQLAVNRLLPGPCDVSRIAGVSPTAGYSRDGREGASAILAPLPSVASWYKSQLKAALATASPAARAGAVSSLSSQSEGGSS